MKYDLKKWFAVFYVVAASMAPAAVLSQGFDGHRGAWHGFDDSERFAEHMTRHFGLDDTQAQSVRNIVDAAAPEMTSLRDKARMNHEAIRALEVTDPDYPAKLSDLARANGELATAQTLLHGRLRAELDAVLTPEQREKIATEGADGRHHWGERGKRDR
jgi:protein CpxP